MSVETLVVLHNSITSQENIGRTLDILPVLRQAHLLHLCQTKSFVSIGGLKSPGRCTLVILLLLVSPRGFFLAFCGFDFLPMTCAAARRLAVSVAGLSPFLRSSFSMSSMSLGSLISWNRFLSSVSRSSLDLGSFGYTLSCSPDRQ